MIARDWCPGRDLNPHSACAKKDFKSFASADFATRAFRNVYLLRLLAGLQFGSQADRPGRIRDTSISFMIVDQLESLCPGRQPIGLSG
jgi:hypothetical protein